MENRIRKHIEAIFAGAPDTAKARDLREEMILNVIERYHDHVGEGLSEEDAYRAAITGIGDVSGLIDSLRLDAGTARTQPRQAYAPAAPAAPAAQNPPRKGLSTGAVVAIVICSTILLLTLISGILAANIVGKLFAGDGFLSNVIGLARDATGIVSNPGIFDFDDDVGFDNAYAETGEYAVSADGVTAVEVNWVAGSVTVLPAPEGETNISFTETSNGRVSNKYALRYGVSGGKLTIRYCDSKIWRGIDWNDLFNTVKSPQKQLTLYIPASLMGGALTKLAVNGVSSPVEARDLALADAVFSAVSGSVSLENSSFENLSVSSVSGSVSTSGCTGKTLNANNVSGGIDVQGAFKAYYLNSVSGNIKAKPGAEVESVAAESVSGGIRLELGDVAGFTASADTVSGQFSSGGFPVSMQGGKYIYGDGSVKLNFDTVSGNINVE